MLGLVLALGVAAIAYAAGADEATPRVEGKVTPKKLDKKKFKPVQLFTEVSTELPVGPTGCNPETGGQCNPESEFIEFGNNIKFKSKAAPFCTASLNGTTTEQAKAACPKGSNIGSGEAAVKLSEETTATDFTVTAFNGPKKNQIRLHAYSPSFGAENTQVVLGIIAAATTNGYGSALSVPDAPDAGGDAFAITKFNATIERGSKVVTARCKAKKMLFKRTVEYDDGSEEFVTDRHNCKRKR